MNGEHSTNADNSKHERSRHMAHPREGECPSHSSHQGQYNDDDYSEVEDESGNIVQESFTRRRNRRRSSIARGKIPTDKAVCGIQFQPSTLRRQSMVGDVVHTPYDDVISEFEPSDVESDHEGKVIVAMQAIK